ncbi:hypothetical protein ACWCPF_01210 [Streptomyces sp. NPDC001858]
MARNIKDLDADLVKAEDKIHNILVELGSVPTQYPTVLFRVLKLEKDTSKLTTDVAATNTAVAELQNKFKQYRWLVIGLVAAFQVFKVDIQAFKLDITLLKEWKRNDAIAGLKNSATIMKATYSKEAKAAVKDEFNKRYESASKSLRAKFSKQARQALDAEIQKKKDDAKAQAKADNLASLRSQLDSAYLPQAKDTEIQNALKGANDANAKIDKLVKHLKEAGDKIKQNAATPQTAPPVNAKGKHSKNNQNNQNQNNRNSQGNQATKKELAEIKRSVTALSEALAGV